MSLQELNYASGVNWVLARAPGLASESALLMAMHGLTHAVASASAQNAGDCALEGLFPGSPLEVLFSRSLETQGADAGSLPPVPASVEPSALSAIGEAIARELKNTGKELMRYSIAGVGEVLVYHPEHREAVLLGSRTTLLS